MTDIPIGARILSVVDCFDALTSDRPYRRSLSEREAIEILLKRRGNMYDPLVVDTFLKVHRQLTLSVRSAETKRGSVVVPEVALSLSAEPTPN